MSVRLQHFIWNGVYPYTTLIAGIIVTVCNAFPFVRIIPGGLSLAPGQQPDMPPFDRSFCRPQLTTMWDCLFADPASGAYVYIIAGLLLMVLGGLFLFTMKKGAVAVACFLVAICGILLMWLTTFLFLNDSSDAAKPYPANTIATIAYMVVSMYSFTRIIWQLGLSPPDAEQIEV